MDPEETLKFAVMHALRLNNETNRKERAHAWDVVDRALADYAIWRKNGGFEPRMSILGDHLAEILAAYSNLENDLELFNDGDEGDES